MKRYYLTTLRANSFGELEPDLAGASVSYTAAMAPNAKAGDSVLVLVAAPDHRALLASSRLDALPDFPLDAKLTAMQSITRSAMATVLQNRLGLDTAGSDGFRDVIRAAGRKLDPNFSENNFDVSE